MIARISDGLMREDQRIPAICGMAVITLQIGDKVIVILTGCRCAVMTTGTGVHYITVIESGGNPGLGGMAQFTFIGAGYMLGMFTRCIDSVMTIETGVTNPAMIEGYIPVNRGMAYIAFLGTQDMQRMFAFGNNTIVTTATDTYDRIVIHTNNRLPSYRSMAVITGIGAQDMGWILTGCYRTIMAIDTGFTYPTVIIYCIFPGESTVTVIAVVSANHMISCLTRCYDPIMTALATSGYRKMIDPCHLLPGTTLVTEFAIIGSTNMSR
jgi:hypothetical protein